MLTNERFLLPANPSAPCLSLSLSRYLFLRAFVIYKTQIRFKLTNSHQPWHLNLALKSKRFVQVSKVKTLPNRIDRNIFIQRLWIVRSERCLNDMTMNGEPRHQQFSLSLSL